MNELILMQRSGVTLSAKPSEVQNYKKAGFSVVEEVKKVEKVEENKKTFSELNADEIKQLATVLGLELAETKKENYENIKDLDMDKEALQAIIDEL